VAVLNSKANRTKLVKGGRTKKKRVLARGASKHIGLDLVPLTDALHRRVFEHFAACGFGDIRNGHQAVFINIDDEGSTLTELAARAKLSKQAMHELVNDLEALGYVERVPSAKDGRSKLIRTTDKGERSIEAAWEGINQLEREWARILGPAEMKALRTALHRLRMTLV